MEPVNRTMTITAKQMLDRICAKIVHGLVEKIKEEELSALPRRHSQMIIKKHKIELLLRKECMINSNCKLRKCLMIAYRDHLAYIIETAEKDCEKGVISEATYITICDELKLELEYEHGYHKLFGDKSKIEMESLVRIYKSMFFADNPTAKFSVAKTGRRIA